MTREEKSIYASEDHKTHSENFNSFLSYVSSTANNQDKQDKDRRFKMFFDEMTVPEMKDVMKSYHETSSTKTGILSLVTELFTGNSRQKQLEKALVEMHYLEALGVVKSPEFANALKADKDFRKYTIVDEAKNLLSGSKLYSVEVSAQESKSLRETIKFQDSRITFLSSQKNELTAKLERVSHTLNNMVVNVRNKFNLSEEVVNELMKMPAVKEQVKIEPSKISLKNQIRL